MLEEERALGHAHHRDHYDNDDYASVGRLCECNGEDYDYDYDEDSSY